MVFQQTSAPTGWTKQTTHDDKAMRLVTGTPSSGGSVAFSTVFGKTATDSFTLLSPTHIPSHNHTWGYTDAGNSPTTGGSVRRNAVDTSLHATTSTGSSGGHTHGMDIRVNYVDFIIANKD